MSEDEWWLILMIILLVIVLFIVGFIILKVDWKSAILNFKLPKPWR